MKPDEPRSLFILTTWVRALIASLKMDGIDEARLIQEAKVDPDLLTLSYCSLDSLVNIYYAAQKLIGPEVAISPNKSQVPSSFGSLSMALLASNTLEDCFDTLVKHNDVMTNAFIFVSDRTHGGRFGLKLKEGAQMPAALVAAILSRALRTAEFIYPSSHLLRRVSLAYPKPANARAYSQFFKAPVQWECDLNALYFEPEAFTAHSGHANPTLRKSAEKQWLKEITQYSQHNFFGRTKAFVKANLSGNRLTIESAATAFSMSVRTFQRRLKEEGTSFSELIDDVRKVEASELLKGMRCSVGDAAYSLGFSDGASFARAFRRWYDNSPEQYRRIHA